MIWAGTQYTSSERDRSRRAALGRLAREMPWGCAPWNCFNPGAQPPATAQLC